MKRKLLLALALGFITIAANAQTTVNFKPGPVIGEDANIFITDGACILSGDAMPAEDLNYSTGPDIVMMDWTFNAIGCPDGTLRSLIRFDELSTIPTSATITAATLRLYGVPSSGTVPGNTNYPGTPYTPGDNRVFVNRITSAWTEGTVTWNTQPTAPTTLFVIPVSATQWSWDYTNSSAALVAAVQNMVSNPSTNLGFMLSLETEINYRSMLFASSDHPDSTLWPELEVTYTLCNANFNFCSQANNPYVYDFTAVDPTGTHLWEVDGVPVGTGPNLHYTFSVGSFTVCHTYNDRVKGRCTRCFRLCIPQNNIYSIVPEKKDDSKAGLMKSNLMQGSTIKGDVGISVPAKTKLLTAKPNPSNSNWEVSLSADQAGAATMRLKTIDGKVILNKVYDLNPGQNTISIPGSNLSAGTYILEMNQNNQTQQLKLVKN